MSRAGGLSLAYFHSVRMCIHPTAPSGATLRRVVPYLQSRKAGVITSVASPPPPKGPSATLNLYLEIADNEAAQKLDAVYSDGTTLSVDLSTVSTPNLVLSRLEKHARALRMKDEALSG